ncbi:hypothetical protein LMG18101_01762 [Ralstonia flaminis]|uniref:Uncharacterized protein n=1 Tax=Ralstonia flaminis TaxID=3058597 RepID=A0ABM9K2V3_9RALS|nr:hypothetical protein LMG18101_01762 [Ralstonia sp. LMG 18101]
MVVPDAVAVPWVAGVETARLVGEPVTFTGTVLLVLPCATVVLVGPAVGAAT